MHVITHVLHCSGINGLYARVPRWSPMNKELAYPGTVAATRLVWTAVILISSETSGPLTNGRVLKMCSLEVYIKSSGGQKGGSLEPPRTPPTPHAYGPAIEHSQRRKHADILRVGLFISPSSHVRVLINPTHSFFNCAASINSVEVGFIILLW